MISMTKNTCVVMALFTIALLAGCDSGYYRAAQSARSSTTQNLQGRYGQSDNYNSQGGGAIDSASGFKRYRGKVAIYNRTNEPVTDSLIGVIDPGDVATTEFFARVGGEIKGIHSGKIYGRPTFEPTRNGLIFVVTSEGVEYR